MMTRWTLSTAGMAALLLAAPQDTGALARFLLKAQLQGYASGEESRIRKLADGGLEVGFAEGPYVYRGRWYAESSFSGQDLVWRGGKPAWSMNFYGATSTDTPVPSEFPKFHKAALRHAPAEAPCRGPALYREGDFVYVNEFTGSLANFSGLERVFFRDREIFRLIYHGGMLQ